MFAGSFSFINAQQFVQSLRSVAANAVGVASGYAFKLALNAMGPTVHNVIQNLQEVMQDINSLMSNSCQLAQGLVTEAFSAFDAKTDMNASTENVTKGIGDVFSQLKPPTWSVATLRQNRQKLVTQRSVKTSVTCSGVLCGQIALNPLSSMGLTRLKS